MTMRTRLKRLEVLTRRRSSPAEDRWEDVSEEDWLELFESWDRRGEFDHEPDFPAALACYREALLRAKEQVDPPFDPPPDFMPALTEPSWLRRLNWRDKVRFPDVGAAGDWLMEMLSRVQQGTPPVSTAEFEELARWFGGHEERLYQASSPSYQLDLGGGRTTTVTNLRYGLRQGVRAFGAGELAEDLRHVRARYGGGET